MSRKHLFWMALGCAIPLAAFALLPRFGVSLGGGVFPLLVLLLCPAVHLLMMFGLLGGHGPSHGESGCADHERHSVGQGEEKPASVMAAPPEETFPGRVRMLWEKLSAPRA